MQIKLTSAGVVEPETTTAEGIKKVIIDKFEAAGINDIEIKLIGKLTVVQKSLTVDIKAKLRIQFSGFGANGTTVNRSDKKRCQAIAAGTCGMAGVRVVHESSFGVGP